MLIDRRRPSGAERRWDCRVRPTERYREREAVPLSRGGMGDDPTGCWLAAADRSEESTNPLVPTGRGRQAPSTVDVLDSATDWGVGSEPNALLVVPIVAWRPRESADRRSVVGCQSADAPADRTCEACHCGTTAVVVSGGGPVVARAGKRLPAAGMDGSRTPPALEISSTAPVLKGSTPAPVLKPATSVPALKTPTSVPGSSPAVSTGSGTDSPTTGGSDSTARYRRSRDACRERSACRDSTGRPAVTESELVAASG